MPTVGVSCRQLSMRSTVRTSPCSARKTSRKIHTGPKREAKTAERLGGMGVISPA